MKKTNPPISRLLLLLLAAGALLAFGVFTNVLTDLWGGDLKKAFASNPWLIAAFALLLGLVGYLYSGLEKPTDRAAEAPVDEDQYQKVFAQFKASLLEQYQLRLTAKTANRLPINLSARPSRFGTSDQRADIYFEELTLEGDDIAPQIGKILDTHSRLLLVGDPGAGKTTILLFAAIHILTEQKDPKLPLLLNLATWNGERTFEDWYAQNVAHSYNLGAAFAQDLLRRNAIVPFFDGFDEIRAEHRESCFREMAAYFGDKRNRQLVVSSRKIEYAAAQADAPVYAELEVLPLSLPQIKTALSFNAHSQTADRALLQALEQDPLLAKAVETPFYLNTASFLFGKGQRVWRDFQFKADTVAGRETELVETFVGEQVPDEKDRKHLAFLAGRMEVDDFLVFELTKMQPWWLKGWWVWKYGWSLSLILGLILGLILSSFGYLVNDWSGGFIYGFSGGWAVGVATALFEREIKLTEFQIWNWNNLTIHWQHNLTTQLKIALLFGPFLGLALSLHFGFTGLLIGLTFALSGGLSHALIKSVVDEYFLLYVSNPYQRFLNAFKHGGSDLLSTLFAIIIFIFFFYETLVKYSAIKSAVNFCKENYLTSACFSLAIISFLLVLHSDILEHFSLRLVLYLENKLPLRVVTFLDRMTDQYIFEDTRRVVKGKKQRGATWRFRHKILQDYLAGLGQPAPSTRPD